MYLVRAFERAIIIAICVSNCGFCTGMRSSFLFSLKQTLNSAGIKSSIAIFRQPRHVIPQISINKLSELNVEMLKSFGINCVIFDKDNTLSITYADQIHDSISNDVANLKLAFPKSLAILSNSVGSCDDSNYIGASQTEKNFGISVIRHQLKKPACRDEVLSHFKTQLNRVVDPSEICLVGDRVLTDVLFANQCGMLSVLVAPLSNINDHPIAVIIRSFERFILLPLLKLFGFKALPLVPKTASAE